MFGQIKNRFSMAQFEIPKLIGGDPATFTPKDLPQPALIGSNPATFTPKDLPQPVVKKDNPMDNPMDKLKIKQKVLREEKQLQNKKFSSLKDSFEGLKSSFLLNKNKAAFIRKRKDMIKNLSNEDQKRFILLAKEHFK